MKVVVAYCRLHPAVRTALEQDGIKARYCETPVEDIEAYWRLLRDLWAEGETFVFLQQDKIPAPGAVQAIHDCPNLWCTYPCLAWDGGEVKPVGLSCVKFAAGLIQRVPGLMEMVGSTAYSNLRLRHWTGIDWLIYDRLIGRYGQCLHPADMVRHEHQEEA